MYSECIRSSDWASMKHNHHVLFLLMSKPWKDVNALFHAICNETFEPQIYWSSEMAQFWNFEILWDATPTCLVGKKPMMKSDCLDTKTSKTSAREHPGTRKHPETENKLLETGATWIMIGELNEMSLKMSVFSIFATEKWNTHHQCMTTQF